MCFLALALLRHMVTEDFSLKIYYAKSYLNSLWKFVYMPYSASCTAYALCYQSSFFPLHCDGRILTCAGFSSLAIKLSLPILSFHTIRSMICSFAVISKKNSNQILYCMKILGCILTLVTSFFFPYTREYDMAYCFSPLSASLICLLSYHCDPEMVNALFDSFPILSVGYHSNKRGYDSKAKYSFTQAHIRCRCCTASEELNPPHLNQNSSCNAFHKFVYLMGKK